MSATIKVILDKRRMKKTGAYPVRFQVTFKGLSIPYKTPFELTVTDFDKLSAPRLSESLQNIRDKLKSLKREAETFIAGSQPFSFSEFEKDFVNTSEILKHKRIKELAAAPTKHEFDFSSYHKTFKIFNEDHSKSGTISIVFLSYIKKLIEEERIGSALNYQDTYYSIKRFRGNVYFSDITVSFLVQYEQWMKNIRNCSRATVGIKLRPLRSIFNEAIEQGIVKKEAYPFGRKRYIIPTGRNQKKALVKDQLKEIYNFDPSDPDDKKAKDYWMLCYLANGINPKDVANLRNKNIEQSFMTFIRVKTERTTRDDPKPITVYLNNDIMDILERRRNPDLHPNSYLFPILQPNMHPLEQHKTIKAFIIFINAGMKRIANHLGIDKKVTSIVSRHSFATRLKQSGVSTEFIQEALGHTNKITTENYLDSFENEVKKEYSALLTNF